MSCMAISDTHSVNNKNKVIKVLIQSLTENYENLVLNFCGEVGDSKENVRRNLTKKTNTWNVHKKKVLLTQDVQLLL